MLESATVYYKWIHDDKDVINGIPGFVFCSLEDALAYADEFDDWSTGPTDKHLYQFSGVAPTTFPIMLGSILGYCGTNSVKPLPNDKIDDALHYFSRFREDAFINGPGNGRTMSDDDINLFMALAGAVGCLKPKLKRRYDYVYDVEAFYGRPVTMKLIDSRTTILVDDCQHD